MLTRVRGGVTPDEAADLGTVVTVVTFLAGLGNHVGRTNWMQSETDEQVMLRIRAGDVELLAVLYQRHRKRLFNFFARLTGDVQGSEDLVHEVFLRLLRYRLTFEDGNRFIPWMYRVARNARNDLAHRFRHETATESAAENDDAASPSYAETTTPAVQVGTDEEVALLRLALAEIPLTLREPLILSRFEDLKYEEIAAILNCDVGAVKMRVHRAMKALRERFAQLAGEDADELRSGR